MHWWQAVILGLVEGITEYLPVSSTGHLILTNALLFSDRLDDPAFKRSVDAFTIVIQGGAILAVLGLYRSRVAQMVRGLLGRDPVGLRLAMNILVAFMPAAVLGLLLDEWIEERLFFAGPVLAALFLGGVWMIWLDRWRRKRDERRAGDAEPLTLETLGWRRALAIGGLQCVAMIPGTSRSMMTIAGGTLLGLKPKDAAEFSFLLGLPTLGGACVLKLTKNLLHARETGEPTFIDTLGWMPTLVGLAVATVSAALAVRWLVSFLTRHGLALFGWYRIALCVVMGGLVLGGVVSIAPGEADSPPDHLAAPDAPPVTAP